MSLFKRRCPILSSESLWRVNVFKHNVPIAVIFAVVVILMWSFRDHGMALFVLSTLALVYGSLVQEGWEKGRRFRTAAFVAALALGGVGSTRAWDLFRSYEEKKSLMLAIARDWKLNDQVLQFPKFGASDDQTLSQHFTYPKFYSESFGPALLSGLFSEKNIGEAETIKTVYAYSITLTKLQNRLDLSDQTIFVGLGRNPLSEWKKVRDSSELGLFKRVHNRLGDLLKREGGSLKNVFLKRRLTSSLLGNCMRRSASS